MSLDRLILDALIPPGTKDKDVLKVVAENAMRARSGETRVGSEPTNIGEVIDLLATFGLILPPDTTEKTLRANIQRAAAAKAGAVVLSAEDFDDLSSIGEGNELNDPIQGVDGAPDMVRLLSALLKMLGVDVPNSDSEADFKRALMTAAMEKIRELTTGKGKGAKTKPQAKGTPNPLIPGNQGEADPIYMSVMDRLRANNETLKMQKHSLDIQLALAPPPKLSAADEDRIVATMARKMGAAPDQGGVTDDDRLADLLVSRMGGAADQRPRR